MSAGFAAWQVIVLGKEQQACTYQYSLSHWVPCFGWIGFNAGSSLRANGVAAACVHHHDSSAARC
jgi:ammonia channel protein AmtB